MPVHTYPADVLSIHEKFGNIPAVIGSINLAQRIDAGTALHPSHLIDAKNTAVALRGLLLAGNVDGVTEEVVQSAEQRLKAIENIHASMAYTPLNISQMLQQLTADIASFKAETSANFQHLREDMQTIREDLQTIREDVRTFCTDVRTLRTDVLIGRAETHNALNTRFVQPQPLVTMQKTVPGSGYDLAQSLIPPTLNAAGRATLAAYAAGDEMNPPPAIGAVPQFFDGNVDNLQHTDILKLICFYNDVMSIKVENDLDERKGLVGAFHCI